MPRGPQHQKLADFVLNAHPEGLEEAESQWKMGSQLLRQVSRELQTKATGMKTAESYSDGAVWSGATASTAREAFASSSERMAFKADEMQGGAAAFAEAASGVRHARNRLQELDQANPGDQPTTPTFSPGPRSHADEVKQSNHDTSVTNWWRDYNANETAATTAITHLQDNHTDQAKVFKSIHGVPVDEPGPTGGGGGPVSTGTRPDVTNVPTTVVNHHGNNNVSTDPSNDPNGPGGEGDNDQGGGNTGPGGGIDTGPGTGTGLPAGPTTTSPMGPLSTGPTTTSGGIGAVGGVGAVAGGAMGGAVAAGLAGGLAGSLRGGLSGLAPAGAGGRGGLSASGVRGIGATSGSTGVGSVLGRGTGTGGSGGAGGTGGRAGAGGVASGNGARGGSRGAAGGGSRGAAGRGSRGAAGARGAGSGGAGAGGGKDKKRGSGERDLFDDGQDWLDDEAQPGLID